MLDPHSHTARSSPHAAFLDTDSHLTFHVIFTSIFTFLYRFFFFYFNLCIRLKYVLTQQEIMFGWGNLRNLLTFPR